MLTGLRDVDSPSPVQYVLPGCVFLFFVFFLVFFLSRAFQSITPYDVLLGFGFLGLSMYESI